MVSVNRFTKPILNEFYQITFRKKLYADMEELQKDLNEWITTTMNEPIKVKCAADEHRWKH